MLAVPEYLQPEIRVGLAEHGFCNVIGMGSELEFELMRDYYREQGLGFADNSQEAESGWPPDTEIYVARSAADKPLAHDFPLLPPFCDVQAGAALDKVSPGTAFRDDEEENAGLIEMILRCEILHNSVITRQKMSSTSISGGHSKRRRAYLPPRPQGDWLCVVERPIGRFCLWQNLNNGLIIKSLLIRAAALFLQGGRRFGRFDRDGRSQPFVQDGAGRG